MFKQVIKIGEGFVPAIVEYHEDETGPIVADRITIISNGVEIPIAALDLRQVEDIEEQLERGHDEAVRDMDWLCSESRAEDRASWWA